MAKELRDILDSAKYAITEGDGLASALPNAKERELIRTFVDEFCETKKPDKEELKLAKKLLKIGKTYYEFGIIMPDIKKNDGKLVLEKKEKKTKFVLEPVFINDHYYSRLKEHYLQFDSEPTPYIPVGRDRIEISDQRLANNLRKSYIVYDGDKIPAGVSEKKSIETFIKDGMKEVDKDEVEIIISPKIDGVSVNTKIKDARFKKPATRGDKSYGVHVKALEGFKISNVTVDDMKAQFEAFMTDANIKKAGKLVGTEYVSGRHSISGIINSMTQSNKDEFDELASLISWYPIESDSSESYKERRKELQKLAVVPDDMIEDVSFTGNKKEILKFVQKKFEEYSEMRKNLSYGIDGIVITFASSKDQAKLGRDGYSNNYQMALKFKPETAKAIVQNVTFSAGNKGNRTPMVVLEKPVVIDGVEYDTAMIKSLSELAALELRRGDEVMVVRTGDVIPSITIDDTCVRSKDGEILGKSNRCEYCGTSLIEYKSRLKCPNPTCKGNLIGLLTNFHIVIGLEGFEKSFAEDLVSAGLITNLYDVLDITESQLNDIGYKKKATQYVEGLKDALSKIKDYQLLAAIGLEQIGMETAKLLASVHSIPELRTYTASELQRKFNKLPGIGDKSAELFANTISNSFGTLTMFYPHIDHTRINFKEAKTIGFTGVEASKKIKEIVANRNWTITEGSSFNMLVTSSHKRDSKKMKRAKDNGFEIFTPDEFIAAYES